MTYLVTARKWRPMVFEDVVGQSHVTATLRNAIASRRLAHAYLFSGPRGIGKTTMARLLAKAVNCRNPKDLNPCNECDNCQEITDSRSIDVFEIDGASNRGIDEIRNLRETVRYGPTKGKYKVYIIDEVHMLTKEAFNALLKTLEEPPEQILFIFATTEVQKVPLTILSRCHRFDFRRIAIEEIVKRLKYIAEQEKVTLDEDSLLLIAKRGEGSLRDAQSVFDQAVSLCGETITANQLINALNLVDQEVYFGVTDLLKAKNLKGGLELVDDILKRGYDIREFLSGLAEHLRNLLIVRSTGSPSLVEASEVFKKRYQTEAAHFTEGHLLRLMKIVAETENAVKWSPQPRVRLEMGILQMIKLDSAVEIQELIHQVEDLGRKINGSSPTGGSLGTASGGESKNVGENLFSRQMHPSTARRDSSPSTNPAEVKPAKTSSAPSPTMITKEPHPSYVISGTPPASETAKASVQVISMDEVQSRWKEFVEEIRRQRIHVGTLLSQAHPLDVRDGAIKVGCTSELHLSTLKRSRDFLVESAQKIYGKKIRFELSLSQSPPSPAAGSGKSNGAPASHGPLLDHPIVQALMRELGAEPLE
jgi:DNA polymerase-3 subunit gamma/tau